MRPRHTKLPPWVRQCIAACERAARRYMPRRAERLEAARAVASVLLLAPEAQAYRVAEEVVMHRAHFAMASIATPRACSVAVGHAAWLVRDKERDQARQSAMLLDQLRASVGA